MDAFSHIGQPYRVAFGAGAVARLGEEVAALGARRATYVEDRLLPKSIIYDPEPTVGPPLSLSVPSGFNSMAHGVSAFFGKTTGPSDGFG